MQAVYKISVLSIIFISTAVLAAMIPLQSSNQIHDAYWVFKKNKKYYRLDPEKAASAGVNVGEQEGIIFRFVLTERDFKQMKAKGGFPLKVEWYRFNRAKLSIFDVQEIDGKTFNVFQDEANRKYYRLSSKQVNVLSGTWMVRISDAEGNRIQLDRQDEFDIIIR